MELPRDPFILYSYLNTLLRDRGLEFSELCRDMELPEEEIRESLSQAGIRYDEGRRQFRF